ncbi:MAG: S9 family peptidase, partial [Pyrinomonadaceae bacterium]
MLVDNGLKENGNQRFLTWSDDSQFLIYEKQENLKIFNLKEQTSKIIQHKNSGALRFFQWYLIRQTAITPKGELYFSAGLKNDKNSAFQLFKLNVFDADIKQLTDSELDVANVAASRDGERVIFNFYQYVENKPESQIDIINTNGGNVLIRSKTYKNTFFSGFKWSPNGNLILAGMSNGQAMLFRFKSGNASLEEVALSLESGEIPVDFYNDSTLLFVKNDDRSKKIGVVNIDTGKKQILIDENSTYLGLATKDGKSNVFFVSESRINPKSIWKIEISGETPSPKIEVKSFESQNPLAKYSYVTYWYKNNAGDLSSSYIYLPADFSKSNKKYSLLIVPYGGYSDTYPDLSYFLYSRLFKYLDEGFIIAFPNTRGIDSERQTKDYGKLQLEDTEKFINEISEKYRINNKRIFALGHSHGATMVYYYLTHSDIFAGGIAIN